MIFIIISIISSILLIISEMLPFLKNIPVNGILQFFISLFKSSNEYNLLDTNNHNFSLPYTNILNDINKNISNYNSLITNIFTEFKSNKHIKLYNQEIYQLNYIINFIKNNYIKKTLHIKDLSLNNKQLLLSENYTINYDSVNNIYTINW